MFGTGCLRAATMCGRRGDRPPRNVARKPSATGRAGSGARPRSGMFARQRPESRGGSGLGLITNACPDLDSVCVPSEGVRHVGGRVRFCSTSWPACSEGGTMSRPQTEAEYLARLVPPSVAGTSLRRRSVLSTGLGLGAAFGGSALLAACGSSSSSSSSGGGSSSAATGTVTLGSNASDAVPKATLQTLVNSFQTANSGLTVKINTVDHNTFQEQINNYLQGKPDDVFTWFAGYRMRYFAAQGLAGDLSDVWGNLQGFNDAFKTQSTGEDGKQYFVPASYYPWAIFYRKSVWDKYGYQVPKTLDEF